MVTEVLEGPSSASVVAFWSMALAEGIALDEREACQRLLERCARSAELPQWRQALRSSWGGVVHLDGQSAPLLHHAAARPHDGWVRLLLQLGAQAEHPDFDGHWPIEWAARAGSPAFYPLLAQGLMPQRTLMPPSPTLLHDTVHFGDAAMVQALLAQPLPWTTAQWDIPDARGCHPLHWAADRNDPALARLLRQAGASVTAQDHQGMTPQQRHDWQFPHDHRAFLHALDPALATAEALAEASRVALSAAAVSGPPPAIRVRSRSLSSV